MRSSNLEDMLYAQITHHRLPTPEKEHVFHPTRKWRFDLAWLEPMLAVEIDGGIWNHGRHTRGRGYEGDCEKLNEAAVMGWTVLRVTGSQIRSKAALGWIEAALDRFYNPPAQTPYNANEVVL